MLKLSMYKDEILTFEHQLTGERIEIKFLKPTRNCTKVGVTARNHWKIDRENRRVKDGD